MKKIVAISMLMMAAGWLVTSCSTNTGTGALVGAGTGAAVAGPPGAAVGAATGAAIGANADAQENRRAARGGSR